MLRESDLHFLPDAYSTLDNELIVANWDGTAGDLGVVCGADECGEFETRVTRMPRSGFFSVHGDLVSDGPALYSYRSLLLSDFDGTTGALRLAQLWPTNPQEFPVIADRVLPARFAVLDPIGLPGAAFVRSFDGNWNAGRLEYENLELQAAGIVHDHVSEFVPILWPAQGVIYVVPGGPDAGVWFARGK